MRVGKRRKENFEKEGERKCLGRRRKENVEKDEREKEKVWEREGKKMLKKDERKRKSLGRRRKEEKEIKLAMKIRGKE